MTPFPRLGLLIAAAQIRQLLRHGSLEAADKGQTLLAHAASCLHAGPGDCPCRCRLATPECQQETPACGAEHPPCQIAPVEDEVHQVGVLFTPNVLELYNLYEAR